LAKVVSVASRGDRGKVNAVSAPDAKFFRLGARHVHAFCKRSKSPPQPSGRPGRTISRQELPGGRLSASGERGQLGDSVWVISMLIYESASVIAPFSIRASARTSVPLDLKQPSWDRKRGVVSVASIVPRELAWRSCVRLVTPRRMGLAAVRRQLFLISSVVRL